MGFSTPPPPGPLTLSRWAISTAKLVRWLQAHDVCVALVSNRRQPCVDQWPIMERSE